MQERNYWTKFAQSRATRRRLLATGLALTAGAAALSLTGCGGDGDDGGEVGELKPQPDRSKEAKRGGTLRTWGQSVASLDVVGGGSTVIRSTVNMFYNRLLKVLPGVNEPASGDIVGDAADSWEVSDGGLKLTLKIRQNLGSDPRPPLNGRNLTAEDVLSSWNRWSQVSGLRGDLLNSVNPDAAVRQVTSPDRNTIIFDLAFPSVILQSQLADGFYFWVMPREANEGVFNPASEAHGAGPYYLDNYVEGSQMSMTRNDRYYEAPIPYFDKQQWFFISELAAQTAQFEAQALDLGAGIPNVPGPVNAQNVADIYSRHRDAILYASPVAEVGAVSRFGFAEGSPFLDERVRQATSMLFDRVGLADYFTNEIKLQQAGIPAKSYWATHISAMWPYVWEDPSKPENLGGNAKYFQQNLPEARKLLEAANQLGMTFEYNVDNFAPSNIATGDLLAGQMSNSGFVKVNQVVRDSASWFLPNIYRSRGSWQGGGIGGIAYKFSPELYIYSYFHPSPGTAHYDQGKFPDLAGIATKMTREFDEKTRTQMVKEFQTLSAKQMPCLPVGVVGPNFTLAWPWAVQAAVLSEWPGDGVAFRSTLYPRYWYDETKKTA